MLRGVTHDYQHHGTTTPFAALDVATGQILAQCKPRHRHQQHLAFLQRVEQSGPATLDAHLVLDNHATHKRPRVKRRLARRPHWKVDYTPTRSSWLNRIEIFFNLITQRTIRRGTFCGVKDLVHAIEHFVQHYNPQAEPSVWAATADSILAKLERLHQLVSGSRH